MIPYVVFSSERRPLEALASDARPAIISAPRPEKDASRQRLFICAGLSCLCYRVSAEMSTKTKFVFSPEEDEKLVEEVAKYPALFDLAHHDYRDQKLKDLIWNEISRVTGRSSEYLYKSNNNMQ